MYRPDQHAAAPLDKRTKKAGELLVYQLSVWLHGYSKRAISDFGEATGPNLADDSPGGRQRLHPRRSERILSILPACPGKPQQSPKAHAFVSELDGSRKCSCMITARMTSTAIKRQ
jgi:hypothetical protein